MLHGIDKAKEAQFIGQKYKKLTAIRFLHMRGSSQVWLFVCECGKEKEARKSNVTRGVVNSCGCHHGLRKHGMSKREGHIKLGKQKPIYSLWVRMRQRCTNPQNTDFKYYGGRGIKICKRWSEFKNFLEDMGDIPSVAHSLDRIDNNGNYKPSNCRWATRFEQSNNRRSVRKISFQGKEQTISAWVLELPIKITSKLLWHRLFKLKWDVERAMTQPPRKMRHAHTQ